MHFGPILDDRLKGKFLKPWKGVLCVHFRVCPSVCPRATGHIFRHRPRNLFFWSNDPWDMRKKHIFLVFFLEIFIFTLFMGIFRFFSYIIVHFCFQATSHNFWPRDVIYVGQLKKNSSQFLGDLCKGTGDYWYNHGMWPIILLFFFPNLNNGNK